MPKLHIKHLNNVKSGALMAAKGAPHNRREQQLDVLVTGLTYNLVAASWF